MWIYGSHAVRCALENNKRHFKGIFMLNSGKNPENESILKLCDDRQLRPAFKDKPFFEKQFGASAVHQGIAAEVEPLSHGSLDDLIMQTNDLESAVFLMLDQVTDPHNVGAIVRSAAAFGVQSVIHPKHQSAPQDSAIIAKTACGGVEHVAQHTVTNFAQTMKTFKDNGYWIIGLDERGKAPIQKAPLKGKIVLIMGAEGKGMRRLTKDNCDVLTHLPTSPQFPTLNVSNAAALSLYEYARQNMTN